MEQILVVDEDVNSLQNVKSRLVREGYQVYTRNYIDEAEQKRLPNYDLILTELIDVSQQKYSFITRLKEKAACPVIIFSAENKEKDIVESLLAGADDYVIKPLRMQELTARVKVALQRKNPGKEVEQIGDMLFDEAEYAIGENGVWISLTRSEYRMCRVLAKNAGSIFSKERLYECLYEIDSDTQLRTITEYIYSVRKKFKQIGINPVKTIWGSGYRWAGIE